MLAGCSDSCDSSTSPGAIGELGNGRFDYACGGLGDPACEGSESGDLAAYFPRCIALGGRFSLAYDLIDGSALESNDLTPLLYIESVNQSFFEGTGEQFEALRLGSAAFVVRESERVLDLIHLEIVEPDGLEAVLRDTSVPTTALEVAVSDSAELRVFPRSSGCTELGGAVRFEAESSDPAIASVSAGEVLRIEGHSTGTAVVLARLGALEAAITVTVVGTPIDPDTGPSPSTESDGTSSGGSSDSAGSDSGTTSDPATSTGSTGETTGASTGGTTTGGT